MLTCKVGEKIISTFEYSDEQIRKWSNKGILKCPVCCSDMIYRHGEIKIAHFAHSKDADCLEYYTEPETEEHINGKKLIYEWLRTQNHINNLKLEAWIPETKQRPDIYFEVDDDRYVIEFQCTPIATEYIQRHRLYELAGIKDIWILGTLKYNILMKDSKVSHDIRLKEIEKHNYCYLNVENNSVIMLKEHIFKYFQPKVLKLDKYLSYSLEDVFFNKKSPNVRLKNEIIQQLNIKDNELYEKIMLERKAQEELNNKMEGLITKLNKQYEKVDGVNKFYSYEGNSGYYIHSITCENIYNNLVFYINNDHTDFTKEYTYTIPFRGKRGGTGWSKHCGHSKVSTINYDILDINIIEKFVVDSVSDFVRQSKYPKYTKEALND